MNSKAAIGFWFVATLALLVPGQVLSQDSKADSLDTRDSDLMTVEGNLVCVAEEMAKLRDKKPNCDKYGHVAGLRVSDGTIWSFYPNQEQRNLREIGELNKKIRIKGRLFYDGKIIEIKEFKLLPDGEVIKNP